MTKVLVFESDASFAGELRNELGKLGCVTSIVDDGNAGLQAASADRPDLILLSIELPRMNGFSVCNKLKKDLKLKDVPLIIMSSESSDETFEQHRKLRTRAEDYVHKPIAFGELLQHIRTFVQIGAGESAPPSEIVIDEEIQIGSIDLDDEATVMAPRPMMPQLTTPQQAKHKMSDVDADVDAFIEGGFGRLQKSDPPPPAAASANGTNEEATQALPKRAKTVPPPVPVDNSKLEALESELMAAREETNKLRADFDAKIEAEQQKMEREMDELKSKLATAATGKGGGVSSREFLDLREALNKKDKEILSLKDSLSKKDKEIFESRDKSLALERGKADLEDRLLIVDREIEDSKEKLESLAKDKDQAKKASEDFKTRLTKSQADLEARDQELTQLKAKTKEDAGALEATLAATRAEYTVAQATLEAANKAAMEQLEREKTAALEAAATEKTNALAEAAKDRAAAILARETELKTETDGKLAALYRAQLDELGKLKNEHAQSIESLNAKYASENAVAQAAHEEQLDDSKRGAEAVLAAKVAELESQAARQLAAAEKDRDDKLAALERDREEKLAALAADKDSRIALMKRGHAEKLASIEKDRDERISSLEKDRDERVAAAYTDRDDKVAALTADRDQKIATLEAVVAGTSAELADLREKKAVGDAANEARIASMESDLQKTRAELVELGEKKAANEAANDARIADLEGRNKALTESKEALDKDLETARGRTASLEAESARQQAELADTRGKLASETARADKAFGKWESDRGSLDRAKDALAAALAQIEEAEGRSIS